jgi:uncharacterized membrane protein
LLDFATRRLCSASTDYAAAIDTPEAISALKTLSVDTIESRHQFWMAARGGLITWYILAFVSVHTGGEVD